MKKKNSPNCGAGSSHPKKGKNDILNIKPDDISIIRFAGIQVRIIKINNEPWFIAKDVCSALELSNHRMTLRALDSDEKGVSLIDTLGGKQKMSIVSESGFYKMVARSHKAIVKDSFAYRFTNWVFREVIPSIRKTGAYGVPFAELNDLTKRQEQYKTTSSEYGRNLQSCKETKTRLDSEEREMWRKYQPDLLNGEG